MIVYAVCLVFGLLFTVISAFAGHFFGGHGTEHIGTGGHAESGFDHSGVPGISFFSPVVLACFITAFGGLGIIFSEIKATESRGASKLTGDVTRIIAQLPPILESLTGVKFEKLLEQVPALRNAMGKDDPQA